MTDTVCNHRWSPMISGYSAPGVGLKEFLTCQDCGYRQEITAAMRGEWWNHYQACVDSGEEYHGVLGDYWPPGHGPEVPMA